MSNGNWQLSNQSALLESSDWTAAIDLSNPSAGLKISCKNKIIAKCLFSFLINDDPIDCYVRNADLVLRYPPRNSDLVSYETYYRYRVSKACNGLELILSAQTSLLDSNPEIKITATFPTADIQRFTSTDETSQYFIVRPHERVDRSILLMAHPSDYHRATVEVDSARIAFWVFPESLEKGVIRRARLQMRMLDRAHDEIQAAEAFAKIGQDSPPLAT